MRFVLVSCLLISLMHAGCTSFRTMTLGRLDSDSLFVECFGHKQKGVPVKLKVPTHVVVSIYEQQVLIRGNDGVKLQSFSPPQYEVDSVLSYTDKVFLVDFARPAGGSLTLGSEGNNGITFDNEQYFQTIQAEVKEETMKQVGKALETLQGAFTSADSTSGVVKTENMTSNLSFERSIIACQRFDLARPHWEDEVNCFVEEYLGKCGSCPGETKPGVSPAPCPCKNKAMGALIDDGQKRFEDSFRMAAPPALERLE
ncbi:hypothetical protein [Gimesia panareensis]|uniref:hypothetical protein n=1 Tax=Gimesia panareensis TaxID=2527978 RepID=UPI00118D5C62|nr:hypothetical protein [Gimesia panareensis]QDU51438.1 hypothetical protein Pan110_38040 [Gimesia panareensis]